MGAARGPGSVEMGAAVTFLMLGGLVLKPGRALVGFRLCAVSSLRVWRRSAFDLALSLPFAFEGALLALLGELPASLRPHPKLL